MKYDIPPSDRTVKRRKVFYIPGFDPMPPRRYRELFRKESKVQAAISGYSIHQTAGSDYGKFGWGALGEFDGAKVNTDYEVLLWSDLVQTGMQGSIPLTYWRLIRTASTYIFSGALRRLMWLRKGPIGAALYPIGFLLVQLGLAILLGWIAGSLTGYAINLFLPPLGEYVAYAVWLAVVAAVLIVFRRYDGKFFAYYLMADYAHTASEKGAYPAVLEARLKEFRSSIAIALSESYDEVLVVGHSSGAHLAISVLADLLRDRDAPGPALSLLTLGQVVPMVSFLPKAERLRRDLHELSQNDKITWVDVSAPGDGCCFALCDPVSVTGVEPRNKIWPLVLSAAFSNTLKPETFANLKRRYFRLHFQYLCAFDQPGHFDYFAITAGPETLGKRYKDKKPSASRIDVAASKYNSRLK